MTARVSNDFPGMLYRACGGSRQRFALLTLFAIIKRRPDVVLVGHANFSPLGWLAALLSRARSLGFIYGIEVWKPLKPLRRWALLKLDRVVSISRFTARRAVSANGLSARKVRILPNCLDPHLAYADQTGEASPAKPPSMLTVARMSLAERYKGHDYVIRALPALLERHPALVYDIIGDGDARPSLEALAGQVGVSEAVRFHGVVSDEELRRRYAEASLFIMPSQGEGFGFVFLEAMAQGTPVIGGNVDATPEVVVDGLTGYLLDPTSVGAIVEAADRLLGDPALQSKMGPAARRHVEEKFGYPRFRQRLISYLR
jgi:glycosyltransferase involved in cell wall biosynthesis